MPKIAEVKLSSCGLEVVDFRKICNCRIAEFRLQSNISLKSYGIAIAEVLPSSCRIVLADSKKSCACPALIKTYTICRYSIFFGTESHFLNFKYKIVLECTGSRPSFKISLRSQRYKSTIKEAGISMKGKCQRGRLNSLNS
jgi:hypothetical protein